MPYGTDAFTDGYGDFKQPTVVDYDISTTVVNTPILSEEDRKKIIDQYKKDQEDTLKEILDTNPYYAGEVYKHLVFAKDNKLAWDTAKILALKDDATWLYNFNRYLTKNKKHSLIRR
jgi:ligand-binding sensor protein